MATVDGVILTQSTIVALAGFVATALVGIGVAKLNSRGESVRLREQFAFHRWETDRQELRSMIDVLASDLAAIPDALDGLARFVQLERSLSLGAASSPAHELTSKMAREMIALADLQDAASRSVERVRLRLDDAATSCLAIADAMIERSRRPIRPWTGSSPDDLEPAREETAAQYRAFVTEARKLTASAAIYTRGLRSSLARSELLISPNASVPGRPHVARAMVWPGETRLLPAATERQLAKHPSLHRQLQWRSWRCRSR